MPQCPKCGGDMWDNGPSKAQGKIKPNAPDYKCKDKNCATAIWPPKGPVTGYAKEQAPKQPLTEKPAALREAGDQLPWEVNPKDEQICALYWDSFDRVLAGLKSRVLKDGFPGSEIAACVETLFIQRSKAL